MSLPELRLRTRVCHERLETRLNLFSNVRTVLQYRAHLEAFFRIYAPVENALGEPALREEWRRRGIDLQRRRKTPLLLRDIQALGGKIPTTDAAGRPFFSTFAESVGTLYVLEGSTLGGQGIAQHYAGRLGISEASGLAFHTGYGTETGALWREFLRALESIFAALPGERETIYRSAGDAFALAEEVLCAGLEKSGNAYAG